jgi:curli biogenesis system outer membrane secretion channel CsgG
MKKFSLFFALLLSIGLYAQTPSKGYIIEMEGSSVYLDYNSSEVQVGDRLQVFSESKTMIHPVTKEKIVKKGEFLATLEITDVQSNYSVAGKVYPANALAQLKVGYRVIKMEKGQISNLPNDGKMTVAIAAATINDVVGPGYFGTYVSDMLMAELLNCPKIKLIDRSLLNAQIDETNLKDAGYIRADQAIMKGQISGVQYMIQVTMQKPDVTNVSTGIPIQSIVNAAGAIAQIAGAPSGLTTGLDIGSDLTSNVRTSKLKSSVSITARIVDVQTGEVLFLCSGTGTSEGEGQAELEGGALGGMQINGGVEGFKQTVTGKAISLAYRKIGNSLRSYFEGTTSEKVINNNLLSDELTMRKGRVYQGVNKLSTADMKSIYETTPELYFDYKKGRTSQFWGKVMMGVGGYSTTLFLTSMVLTGEVEEEGAFLAGIVVTCGGFYLNKSGTLKIRKGIESHNQSLRQTHLAPEYKIGLSPAGLALALSF